MTDSDWVYYAPVVDGVEPEDYRGDESVQFQPDGLNGWSTAPNPSWSSDCTYRYKPTQPTKPELTGYAGDWNYHIPNAPGQAPEQWEFGCTTERFSDDFGLYLPCNFKESWVSWPFNTQHRWKQPITKLTGGSSDYYKLQIGGQTVECQDIIEALNMTFSEGNVFKAVWRIAAERQGNGKPGTTALYDSEKIVFFGEKLVAKNTPDEGEE